MFNGRVNLSSLLVPLSGQASHIVPLVLGGGTDLGSPSIAERAIPTCRALDMWAARASASDASPLPVERGFGFQPAFAL